MSNQPNDHTELKLYNGLILARKIWLDNAENDRCVEGSISGRAAVRTFDLLNKLEYTMLERLNFLSLR